MTSIFRCLNGLSLSGGNTCCLIVFLLCIALQDLLINFRIYYSFLAPLSKEGFPLLCRDQWQCSIMVTIVNDRRQSSMAEQLLLFLGSGHGIRGGLRVDLAVSGSIMLCHCFSIPWSALSMAWLGFLVRSFVSIVVISHFRPTVVWSLVLLRYGACCYCLP